MLQRRITRESRYSYLRHGIRFDIERRGRQLDDTINISVQGKEANRLDPVPNAAGVGAAVGVVGRRSSSAVGRPVAREFLAGNRQDRDQPRYFGHQGPSGWRVGACNSLARGLRQGDRRQLGVNRLFLSLTPKNSLTTFFRL